MMWMKKTVFVIMYTLLSCQLTAIIEEEIVSVPASVFR